MRDETLANCLMGHPIGIVTHQVSGSSAHAGGTKANAHALASYRVAYDPVIETTAGLALVPVGLALYAVGLAQQTVQDCVNDEPGSPCGPVIDCTQFESETPCKDVLDCAMRQPGTMCKAAYDLLVGMVTGCLNNGPTSPCRQVWDCVNRADGNLCQPVYDAVGLAVDCARFDEDSLCEYYRQYLVDTYQKCLSGENPNCKAVLDLVEECLGNHPQQRAAGPCAIIFQAVEDCLDGTTPACATAQECLSDGINCAGLYQAIQRLVRDTCGDGGEDCVAHVMETVDAVIFAVQQAIDNLCDGGANACVQMVVGLVQEVIDLATIIVENLCNGGSTSSTGVDETMAGAADCISIVLELVEVLIALVLSAAEDVEEAVREFINGDEIPDVDELVEEVRPLFG